MAASAPRKRASSKTTTRTSPARRRPAGADPDKPKLQGLNLDTLEREGGEPEPFAFHLAGEQFWVGHPGDVDWQELAALDQRDVVRMLRLWLGEDFERFAGLSLPLWKMQGLVNQINAHFKLSAEDLGEDDALPT